MATSIHWKHKRRLKPFTDAYLSIFQKMGELTVEQLLELRKSCQAATKSNCGWHVYQAAQVMLPEIEIALRCRHTTEES